MKRLTQDYFEALVDSAPVMVVPFGRGAARIVPRETIPEIKSGIITMSPLAVFFLECKFVWRRFEEQVEMRRWVRTEAAE
jgi:hypothetical protein